MTCSPPQVWDGVLRRLREELPPFAVQAWLDPLVAEPDGEGLRLICPTPLHRRRVVERYQARIRDCLESEAGCPVVLRVELGAPTGRGSVRSAARAAPRRPGPAATEPAPPKPVPPEVSPGRLVPGNPARGQCSFAYTFENFVVDGSNALAREAAWALAQGSQLSVSPLYLASAPGLGKTHLARALLAQARTLGCQGALYAPAEQFTSDFMTAIRRRGMAEFKRRYRTQCDLLVLEDVQFLSGKEATQLELFHVLQSLTDAGVRIVLTGSRLPRELEGLERSLSSRMSSGLVAEIEPPPPALRRDILRLKAAHGGVRVPPECLDRLVEAVPGSIRELESSLIQLVTTASLLKRPIDLELTEAALRKVLPGGPRTRELVPLEVVECVAAFFGTTLEALASRSRRRDVLVPRKIAMYLCRRYTGASLKEIGRSLGRNHPSVANAISSVERAMLERAPLRYKVEALIEKLDAEVR